MEANIFDGCINLKRIMLRCAAAMSQPQTRMVCCCSLGRAWGRGCDLCPAPGSPAHAELCGDAAPGQVAADQSEPGIWSRDAVLSCGWLQVRDPMTGSLREIDECALLPGICRHGRCLNTVGSFTCDCHPGYRWDLHFVGATVIFPSPGWTSSSSVWTVTSVRARAPPPAPAPPTASTRRAPSAAR